MSTRINIAVVVKPTDLSKTMKFNEDKVPGGKTVLGVKEIKNGIDNLSNLHCYMDIEQSKKLEEIEKQIYEDR